MTRILATEEWDLSAFAPTGRLVQVERAELRDFGGNVWARARTVRGVARAKAPNGLPVRWVATRTGRTVSPDESPVVL